MPFRSQRNPASDLLLKTAQVSLADVLVQRRKLLWFRLAAILVMLLNFGPLIGWQPMLILAAAYMVLQGFEVLRFPKPHAAGFETNLQEKFLVLAVLVLNSVVFGLPTLVLTRQVGSWGDVCAAYLICGTILSSVLLTIGCRAAFRASTLPYFIYVCILPFNTVERPGPPPDMIFVALLCTSAFMIFNVWQLWRAGTLAKSAELGAVRQYVAERDAHERRLFHMTQHDTLTGLVNRAVLQAQLAQNATDGGAGTLLLIDLDGFKYVNDTLGHSAGDRVLGEIAARLKHAAQGTAIAARLGGDEFALLIPGIQEEAAAAVLAEAVIAEVSQPVDLDGDQLNIGASIGIAVHPLHGTSAEQLFSNADLALYQAKAEGRHCARLYHPDLRKMAQGKVLRDTELRQALERGEFEMFYQPQIRLKDGTLAGAEALLRWHHPVQGLLTPARFLASLEGGLLSARVGAWAIETSCRQAAIWRGQGAADFRIGVNLFGAQFRSGNLVAWVAHACQQAGLPLSALEIEITENVILRHEDNMIAPLRELRELGAGVAFDDYGTGFASLSMLTRFPVSRLKIDRGFTAAICEDSPEAAIVQAIISLARALDLSVTAEGIETAAEADLLARLGCDEGQGFYLGQPMSAAEFSTRFQFGASLAQAY